MNLKAWALLTLTIAFWLGAAHAQEHFSVRGSAPITNRFFALERDCRDARQDAERQAHQLCRRHRHRNADRSSFAYGGCWSFRERSVNLRFVCE